MSDTADRLARAIGESVYGYCTPDATPNTWATALSAAHAALAAIRIPTDDMILSGAKAASDQHYYKANAWERCVAPEFRQDWLNGAKYGWIAMIETAAG